MLVRLELLPSRLNGGVFVCRPLQFDDDQGEAVDEEHDVGNALSALVLHLELVDDKEVVLF